MFPGCRALQLLRHAGAAKGRCPGNGIRGFCNAHFSFPRRPEPQSSAWKIVSGIASVVSGALSEGREYRMSKGKQLQLWIFASKYEREQKTEMEITLRRYVTLRALELELNKNKNRTKTYYFHLLEKVLSIMEDKLCNDILDMAMSQKLLSESKDILFCRANDETKVRYLHSKWLTKSRDFANKRYVIQSGLIEALRLDSGAKFSEKDLVKVLSEKLLGGSALVEKLRPESVAERSVMNFLKLVLGKLRVEEDTLQPPASMYARLCLVPDVPVDLIIPGPYGERDATEIVVAYIHKRHAGPAGIPFEFDKAEYWFATFISCTFIFVPKLFNVMDALKVRNYLNKRHPNSRNM